MLGLLGLGSAIIYINLIWFMRYRFRRVMLRTDIHQHLWPEALVAALTWRREPPLLRRARARWVLRLRDEPELRRSTRATHDPEQRARLARGATASRRALLAISSPLGIEAPAPRRGRAAAARPTTTALLELGDPFGVWGAVALRAARSRRRRRAARRRRGRHLAARRRAGRARRPRALRRAARAPRACAARRCSSTRGPIRGARGRPQAHAEDGVPGWWPAMTRYVADMNAAWHAFAAFGRARHPRLRVVFAMLAGGAPLHAERLAARGGPAERGRRRARLLRHLVLRRAHDRRRRALRRHRPARLRLGPAGRRRAAGGAARRRGRARRWSARTSRACSAAQPVGGGGMIAPATRARPDARRAARARRRPRGAARRVARTSSTTTRTRARTSSCWRDEHVAVWLICWMDDHDTGFHDHDVSCGALAVASGAVVEERLALGGPPVRRALRAGEALDFGAADIHRVAHGGGGPGDHAQRLLAAAVADGRLRVPADAASCSATRSPTPRSCARSASRSCELSRSTRS